MTKKKEIVGYRIEDGNIYCVECINKNREIMEKIGELLQQRIQKKVCIFVKDAKSKSNKLI